MNRIRIVCVLGQYGVFGSAKLVHASVQEELLEYHLVLGECARLVGEQVLDLAEVFVDLRVVRLGGYVHSLVVHLDVPLEELRAQKALRLDGNIHRDRSSN